MHSFARRLAGLGLALVMIPVFIGLLACMPVPIGDPEKSRIDDAITGAWLAVTEDEQPMLFVFMPYDKRTWHVRYFDLHGDYDQPVLDLDRDEVLAGVDSGAGFEFQGTYKAWRTKLGGEWFLVWEPICDDGSCDELPDRVDGVNDDPYWHAWKTEWLDEDRLRLYTLNIDSVPFEEIEELDGDFDPLDRKLRRKVERIVRRNVDNPDIYADSADEEAWVMFRLSQSEYDEI